MTDLETRATWRDRVQVRLEVATGVAGPPNAVWDRDLWDRGQWAGTEPTWDDRTCDVIGLTIDRGRDNVLEPFGTSSLEGQVLNDAGQWSWQPDVPADQLPVDVGRAVRVTWLDLETGVLYPAWRGFLENVEDVYNVDPFVVSSLVAFDGFGNLGRATPVEQTAAGDNDTATVRVGRLLDQARWPKELRDLGPTSMLLGPTTFGRSVPQELGDVADSVGGAVFMDRAGRVALRGRDWLRTDPAAMTVQAVVGNTGAEDVCPAAISLHGVNGDGLVNLAQVARWDQDPTTTLQFEDTGSSSRYGLRTWSRSGLFTKADADLGVIGRRAVGIGASSAPRISAIDIDPVQDPQAWPFVLGVDYGWRIRVDYQHPRSGWTWSLEGLVQRVHHAINRDDWLTTLGVVDAAAFPAGSAWDAATWDHDVWAGPVVRSADLERTGTP